MSQMLTTALILITAAVAVLQDLKIRKVRNWLMLGVLSVYGALLLTGVLTVGPWPYNVVIINIIIGTITSVAMWLFGIWPAGDAKLFIVFVILLPHYYYTNENIIYFPSLTLLLNIFCLGVGFLCLKAIVRLVMYAYSLAAKGVFLKTALAGGINGLKKLPAQFNTLAFFLLTYLVARMVGDYVLGYGFRIFKSLAAFQFLIIFFFYRQLTAYFRSKLVMATCVLILLMLMFLRLALMGFDYAAFYVYMIALVRMSLYSIVAIQILITAFDVYINATQVFEITPDRLEPWIIIDRESVASKLKEHGVTIKFSADGIEPQDVETLKQILPRDYKIKVHKTFPFSPFVAGGVVLTMLLKMSLLHLIMMRLR